MAESDPDPVFKPPNPVTEFQKVSIEPVTGCPKASLEPVIPDLPVPLTEKNPPQSVYFLEIMKNGSIIGRIDIKKNRLSFGRSRDADVPLDHPSISRYHAVILWKDMEQSDRGYFYLMDLNSTHGTILNKNKVTSGTIVKIPIGNNVIKFGGSSRFFMLNSVVTEDQRDEEVHQEVRESIVSKPDTGCSWGMAEDANDEDGEEDDGEEAFMEKFTTLLNTPSNEASPNEHAFSEHPQRTLQIWFDQEGYDFEYQVLPEGSNFKATIQLPIEGRDVAIEGPSQSKKKDAITQLCLKVCKLLDRAERLFPWQHQNAHKRSRSKMEDDEEEDLYDETEESKVKKAKKLLLEQKVKERQVGAETFESLKFKYEQWTKELDQVENQLKLISASVIKAKKTNEEEEKTNDDENGEEIDSLEMFMKQGLIDDSNRMEIKIEKSRLRMKMKELQKKKSNCEKLMKIACPTHIPSFNVQPAGSRQKSVEEVNVRCASSVQQSTDDEKLVNKGGISGEIKPVQSSSKFQMRIVPKSLSCSKLFAEDSIPESISNERRKDESVKSEGSDERGGPEVTKTESCGSMKCMETKKKNIPQMNLGIGASLTEMKQQAIIESDEGHEDFIGWVPPKNQDGSGRTSLNEKFGY